MLTFPTELPAPDPSGYKLTPADLTSRTEMSSGYSRTRPRATTGPTQLEAKWVMSNEQEALLGNFYRYALRQGSDSFLMPVWVGGIFHTQQVIFNGPPVSSYFSHTMWEVTATLTIINDLGPSAWVELLPADIGTDKSIVTLSSQFRVQRVDLFCREATDSSPNDDTVVVGYSNAKLVEATAFGTNGVHTIVRSTSGTAGDDMGNLVTSVPKTLTARWDSTESTTGNLVVIVFYRND